MENPYFNSMRFALAILVAGIFLTGCGGGDDENQPISTTTVDPNSPKNNGGATPTKKSKPGPMPYGALIRKREAKPVNTSTNKVYRYHHFTKGTDRFTGIARNVSTNGITYFPIKDGLFQGGVKTRYPKRTNLLHRAFYIKGWKNGREYYWHKNGQLKIQGQWTNGVRTGVWFLWHDDGTTNRVDLYANGKYMGKHKSFLSAGMKYTWKSEDLKKIYVGKPQATIQKAFGSPDKIKGANWIYYGVKVANAVPDKVAVTVTFVIQNGTVASVLYTE